MPLTKLYEFSCLFSPCLRSLTTKLYFRQAPRLSELSSPRACPARSFLKSPNLKHLIRSFLFSGSPLTAELAFLSNLSPLEESFTTPKSPVPLLEGILAANIQPIHATLPSIITMAAETPRQYVPLTCHGHSRPVPHISFSLLEKEETYYMISACKGMCMSSGDPATGSDS